MSMIRNTGSLMLGTRFSRAGKSFLNEICEIYKSLEIDFEPSWFPLFFLLDKKGDVPVSSIAQELETTQSAASQLVTALEKKKLVRSEKSDVDKRVKIVSFTEKGRALQAQITPIWKSMEKNMNLILSKGENSGKLLVALGEIEELMSQNSLSEIVLEELRNSKEMSYGK